MRYPGALVPLLLPWLAPAQEARVADTLRAATERGVEQAADERAGEERALGEIEWLSWLADHPLDLETVRGEELEALPRVMPSAVATFLAFRAERGGRLSSSDLRLLAELQPEFVRSVLPFVARARPSDRGFLRGEAVDLRARASRDLQPCAGYLTGAFAGSSLHLYNRVTITPASGVRLGILGEKDAGEGYAYGLYSAYIAVRELPLQGELVAGDFKVSVGQGLVLGRSAAFGVAADPVPTLTRRGLGLEPYRSTGETRFFRGVGISGEVLTGMRITAFYSDRKVAAHVHEDGCIAVLDESGLFRTAAEIDNFARQRVRAIGATIAWEGVGSLRMNATMVGAGFERKFDPDDPGAFHGKDITLGSLDVRWRTSDVLMFCEAARGEGGGTAVLAGAVLDVGVRTSCGITIRHYSRSFFSPFGQGYAQNDAMRNEDGVAVGLETTPVTSLRLTAFLDLFRNPSPTPTRPFPVRGLEQSFEATLTPVRGLDATVRYALRLAETGVTEADALGRDVTVQADRRQERVRLTLSYAPTSSLRLRARGEWTMVNISPGGATERGAVLWQDVRVTPIREVTAEARVAIFDAPTYETHIAMMENDLPGVFSVPPLYGRGVRWYVMVSVRPVAPVRLSARYAETRKEGVRSMGSGLMEIGGDTDNSLGLQLDVRL